MTWIECGTEHLEAIREILNEAIVHTTARYDYQPKTMQDMEEWFAQRVAVGLPVIGLVDETDTLVGFGTYGPFRAFAAYKYTVEHSLYLKANQRGKGWGRQMLERLIQRAEEQDYHTLVGVIDAENASSILLHERLGFEKCGIIRHAGYKFGRWLDLAIYQRLLAGPEQPVEHC
jgi:L-amino acid N-acyltransferase